MAIESTFRSGLAVLATLMWGCLAFAQRPADGLLKLVPPDAGMVLAVEDLRGRAAELSASTFAADFDQLPSVKAWKAGPAARQFEAARKQVELAIDAPWTALRDEIFGEAVVLCLQVPPGQGIDRARGLLLIRTQNRKLLERLIRIVNDSQSAQGQLAEVQTATYRGQSISTRRFRAASKLPEFYAVLDDGVFAWSNEEGLVKGAIERRLDGAKSLADLAEFQELRAGLPVRSLVSLIVSPRFLERIIGQTPVPSNEDDRRAREVVVAALKGLRSLGASLEWSEGVLLHTHEILEPKEVPGWVRRWIGRSASSDRLAARIPRGALVSASGSIDFGAALDGFRSFLTEPERGEIDLLMQAARGFLLGQDPMAAVLPKLGPGAVAYLDVPEPSASHRFRFVAAIELAGGRDDPALVAALDNGLRTLLAIYALDSKQPPQAGKLKVEDVQRGGRRMTGLSGGLGPFFYGFGPGYLALGTSIEALARFDDGHPDELLARLKGEHSPKAGWYARADLARMAELAQANRAALAKQFGGEADFDQALAVLRLFPTGFAAMTIEPDLRSIHRVVALLRPASASPAR